MERETLTRMGDNHYVDEGDASVGLPPGTWHLREAHGALCQGCGQPIDGQGLENAAGEWLCLERCIYVVEAS